MRCYASDSARLNADGQACGEDFSCGNLGILMTMNRIDELIDVRWYSF